MDTATTDTYTYCHTLSLHDALPIFPIAVVSSCAGRAVRPRSCRSIRPRPNASSSPRAAASALPDTALICRVPEAERYISRYRERRSEEHTSELQSLMRISYAVFCLKKKNQNNYI